MTVRDIFELRKQGRIEEAYDAIRAMYAVEKGPHHSLAMFWTATDVFKKRLSENRQDEARKIYLSMKRLLPNVPDNNGWAKNAFTKCEALINNNVKQKEKFDSKENQHIQTGIWGEELAAEYLRNKGYVILERDWHSCHRDIDIIAQKEDCIVFVEVKTRSNSEVTDPVTAVDYKKRQNLKKAINHYIKYKKIDSPFQFDVITVVGTPQSNPTVTHIENFVL